MASEKSDIKYLIGQLNENTSKKRRSAAKKLRKFWNKETGPELIKALKEEIKDERTWETQYHMIMAIGENEYTEGLSFLYSISKIELKATMVLVATGDAITRLEIKLDRPFFSLKEWLKNEKKPLLEGAFRALALKHIVPTSDLINEIISYANKKENVQLAFWVVAACPGWEGNKVTEFLKSYLNSEDPDKKRAAEAALRNKYLKWNPL